MSLNDPVYMNQYIGHNFVSQEYKCEVVKNVIYLGTLLNNENNLEEEIKHSKLMENTYYSGLLKQMKSKLLKIKPRCQL